MAKHEGMRRFGCDLVGEISWGTHLCQFYENKQDLIDILVPYFAEGLRHNEFCMWITSAPLEVEEAKCALRRTLPNLNEYIAKGQIEIISYDNWYLQDGKFDCDRVLQGWVQKEKAALNRGFDGLRLTGNTFWVERSLWGKFVDYEQAINDVIGEHKMIALCTYCLKNCTGTDVIDVVRNHVGTLIKQGEKWSLIEDVYLRKKVDDALSKSEQRWSTTLASIGDAVIATDMSGKITFMNAVAEGLTGWKLCEALMKPVKEIFNIINEQSRLEVEDPVSKVLEKGAIVGLANHTVLVKKNKTEVAIDDSGAPIKDKNGKTTGVVLIFRDITERKKAEEAVRESEERFSKAFHNSPIPQIITRFDDWRYVDANESVLRLLGFSREELLGHTSAELNLISLDKRDQGIRLVNDRGELRDFETAVRTKSGKIITVLTSTATITLNGQKHLINTFIDITLRKQMQAKLEEYSKQLEDLVEKRTLSLKESEARYRTLFDSIDEGFCIIEMVFDSNYKPLDYRFLEVNASFERQTGLHNAEGKLMRSFAPNHEEYWFEIYGKVALTGESVRFSNEAKALNRFYDVYAFPVGEGKIRKVGILFNDISERIVTEQKLLAASLYSRSLLEASLDLLVTISKEGKITDVNKATEDVTGYSRVELIGSDFCDYFTHPDEARAGYLKVFTEGYVKDYPLAIRHKNGKITEVLYNAQVYRNPQGEIQGVFAAARDITERKMAEEQAEETAKKLKDAERLAAIGATAGMVGHDIRNPLQAITGDVYLTKTELAAIPESEEKKNALESLQEIEKNIDYINKIVADLQDFARPLNPHFEETDVEEVINDLLEKNGLPMNVEVTVKVDAKARKVLVDASYLNRILYNLVTNAVQAMPKGGKLTIHAFKDKTTNDAVITVEDTGVGIPENVRGKLFTPMFTTKSKGQGFGLAVIKRMAEALKGSVSFESQVGMGTKFTVLFPQNFERKPDF